MLPHKGTISLPKELLVQFFRLLKVFELLQCRLVRTIASFAPQIKLRLHDLGLHPIQSYYLQHVRITAFDRAREVGL